MTVRCTLNSVHAWGGEVKIGHLMVMYVISGHSINLMRMGEKGRG